MGSQPGDHRSAVSRAKLARHSRDSGNPVRVATLPVSVLGSRVRGNDAGKGLLDGQD